MKEELSNRQKLILKAIIEEYVESNEAVGSKILTQKPNLNYSSATIRYDMAYLEEVGLIIKTHTSSGRIPSEKGYRYYVEHLVTKDHEVIDKFPLIDQIFSNPNLEKEEILEKAINMLSSITNYMTLASSSHLENNVIKKIDLIQLNNAEALMLVITDQGHVEKIKINIPNFNFSELSDAINTLDKILSDKYVSEVSNFLESDEVKEKLIDCVAYYDEIVNSFAQAFAKFSKEKIYQSNLDAIFNQPEFQDVNTVKRLINTISNGDVLDLVSQSNGLSVRIGNENNISTINDCTVISIPYSINDVDSGTIAVIGPTRMEYKKVIPLLEYIANNMSKLFDK